MIKVARFLPSSLVDGEGVRAVFFLPGCKHNCKGCHNPSFQNPSNFSTVKPSSIIRYLKENKKFLDGVTLSGGDPCFDVENTLNVISIIKQSGNFNICLYTGNLFKDVPNELKDKVDCIIDGKYNSELEETSYAGSSNQKMYKRVSGIWRII